MIGYINDNSGSTQFDVYTYGSISSGLGLLIVTKSEYLMPYTMSTSRYYFRWLPSYISSGQFYVENVSYNFSDYSSGVFYFSRGFSGIWKYSWYDPQTFSRDLNGILENQYISYFETNILGTELTPIVGNAPNLRTICMSQCEGFSTFSNYETPNFLNCGGGMPVNVYLPRCKVIGSYAFWGNGTEHTYISSIILPVCNGISQAAFGSITITLCNSSVCSLASETYSPHTWGGIGAGFSKSACTIYVPSSLVSAYKSSPYWYSFSSRIFPIPE